MILLDSITLSSVSIIVKLFDIQFLLIGNVACGTRVQTARIVGGTIAKPGAWPWQVTMDYICVEAQLLVHSGLLQRLTVLHLELILRNTRL